MDGIFLQGPTPPISLEMAIDSPVWHLSTGFAGRPKLIFTITSHFDHPITLRTVGTVLRTTGMYNGIFVNQRLTIKDSDSGQRLYLQGNQPHNPVIRGRRLGTRDERNYITLQPGSPIAVSYGVPCLHSLDQFEGGGTGILTTAPRSRELGGEVFRRYFEPGHKYRIEVQNKLRCRVWEQLPEREDYQVGFWWRYGTKEQVMAPPATLPFSRYIGWTEHEIQISGVPGVELRIEE